MMKIVLKSIIASLTVLIFISFSKNNKNEECDKINRKTIENALPENYRFYLYDSINNPNSGFIIEGDSIKLDFSFYNLISKKILSSEQKNLSFDTICKNYVYRTSYSKKPNTNKYRFQGYLYKISEDKSKYQMYHPCLLTLRTNPNVSLFLSEIETFKKFISSIK